VPVPGTRSRGFARVGGQFRIAQRLAAGMCLFAACFASSTLAEEQDAASDPCRRPNPGSAVAEPQDLRSADGVLKVDLALYNSTLADGSIHYCYLTPEGAPSPTLRVKPGDLLILRLRNKLADFTSKPASADHVHDPAAPIAGSICTSKKKSDPCASGAMTPVSTNLHFHGLTVPPVCHQDDVIKTSIQPDDAPFEYRVQIPADESPGLYWYHPHIHGFSKVQVLGGASGALIVEGIERADRAVAGLAERVLIIRDQELRNPDAPPAKSEPVVPKNLVDNDGDAVNTGTGFGKPSKDLSINFVPVPYPDYPPATLAMKPRARELWRVLNASAITYLNLALLSRRTAQPLGLVAVDGVPINFNGSPAPPVEWLNHIGIPPGARAEFIVEAPPPGVPTLLVTRTVDTGPGGENDPNRALASIIATADAPEPRARLSANPEPLPPAALPWVGNIAPTRVRKLYFSEKLDDPSNPTSASAFYITVDGETPTPFDPASSVPDIVVKQGDVEDWIIENRSMELHDFHIHQLHFQLLDWSGIPVNEPFLRDTVNVPYYSRRMLQYPSVRLRMDFRDPNIVGTFLYHCHVLEHEDGGMMGRIRVEPANSTTFSKSVVNQASRGDYDAR